MRRILSVLHMVVAFAIVAGAFGHGIGGVEPVRVAFAAQNMPEGVARLVFAVWYFCSAAMLTMGIGVAIEWWRRLRDPRASALLSRLVALTYAVYGAWALFFTGTLFFGVFLVLGVLLALSTANR
jgi:hypothetical protein